MTEMLKTSHSRKHFFFWDGDMVKSAATLSEDSGLVPSTHVAPYKLWNPWLDSGGPLLASVGTACTWCKHADTWNKYILEQESDFHSFIMSLWLRSQKWGKWVRLLMEWPYPKIWWALVKLGRPFSWVVAVIYSCLNFILVSMMCKEWFVSFPDVLTGWYRQFKR